VIQDVSTGKHRHIELPPNEISDAAFVSHARTWLPIYRQMVEAAISGLIHIANGDCDQDCYEERARLTLDKLNRLAAANGFI
jgi:hypothetical protein